MRYLYCNYAQRNNIMMHHFRCLNVGTVQTSRTMNFLLQNLSYASGTCKLYFNLHFSCALGVIDFRLFFFLPEHQIFRSRRLDISWNERFCIF